MVRFVVAAAALLAGSIAADAGAPPAPTKIPACVSVKSESRYVPYGYNHVVIVTNGCSKPTTCTVSTDVNPSPSTVDVAAGKSTEVLTWSGSPSQVFTPRVGCVLR